MFMPWCEIHLARYDIEQMRVAIRAKMVQIYGIACSNNTLTRHKIQWQPMYLTTPKYRT